MGRNRQNSSYASNLVYFFRTLSVSLTKDITSPGKPCLIWSVKHWADYSGLFFVCIEGLDISSPRWSEEKQPGLVSPSPTFWDRQISSSGHLTGVRRHRETLTAPIFWSWRCPFFFAVLLPYEAPHALSSPLWLWFIYKIAACMCVRACVWATTQTSPSCQASWWAFSNVFSK